MQSESRRSCRNLGLLDSIFYGNLGLLDSIFYGNLGLLDSFFYGNLGLLLLDCTIYGAAELFLTPCQEIGIWASFTTFSPFSDSFLIIF